VSAEGVEDDAPGKPGARVRLADVVGSEVRVVARRGYVVEGTCVDAWPLDNGGVAVRVKPSDGSALREVTTVQPIVLLPGQDE
jgi:hypothetical protein